MLSRFAVILLFQLILARLSGSRCFCRRSCFGSDQPKIRSTQSLKSFTQVYDVVEQNFADPVKSDTAIYKGAIPGMLRTLDPHSNFFDPKEYASHAGRSARALLRHRNDGRAAWQPSPW